MENNIEKMRKKRYGQYFSGKRVADILVDMIPDNVEINSVIDPMVGSGDMLKAVLRRTRELEKIVGIDIDPKAIKKCKREVLNVELFAEDAFTSEHLKKVNGWDLVITNPPYVRYQLLNTNDTIGLPTGEVIRKNLLKFVKKNNWIDSEERELLVCIIKNYSGLADLAVPSWILCSVIVKKNGYLAMVVPETWLNRDYALPIHYMLMKCYDVQYIAKDIGSVWFDNVSVRTCLVVAKKRAQIRCLQSFDGNTKYIEIGASLLGQKSLVENLVVDKRRGKIAFLEAIRNADDVAADDFSAKTVNTSLLFIKLMRTISTISWISNEDKNDTDKVHILPKELLDIVAIDEKYESLEDLGWHIGQGLRSGANEFFYCQLAKKEDSDDIVCVKTRDWNGENLLIPKSYLRLAIQNRSEIKGLCVKKDLLHKCIFYIRNSCTKEDYENLSPLLKQRYSIMDSDMQKYISKAEKYVGPKNKKKFKELSAVAPNEKKGKDGYRQFWYMLPVLQKRHEPDLCISRVCGKSVESLYINNLDSQRIVVDANFITLWNDNKDDHAYAFALLNSTWFKCYMEFIGTRMGGGALKVEASHVKQVLFPKISEQAKKIIDTLGKQLMEEAEDPKDILEEIDRVIFLDYDFNTRENIIEGLNALLNKKLGERGVDFE